MTPARQALMERWLEMMEGDEEVPAPPMFGNPDGDPLDDAVLGLTEMFHREQGWQFVWVYDYAKLHAIVSEQVRASQPAGDVDADFEASEHIAYNLSGGVAFRAPLILWPVTSDESAPG